MDYWKNNINLEHITPPGERFPELGIFNALSRACEGSVFEFGCGDGRLAPAFNHALYHGYDINQHALDAAIKANPHHAFVNDWVAADTFLAYTVLLHIPDGELPIERMKQYGRIVIGEITGRQWRRGGNPPVFNREISEYADVIGVEPEIIKVPYQRYKCDLDLMVFSGY